MTEDEAFSETLMDTMSEMLWWAFDADCVGMGAYRQFDYTMRGDLGPDLSPRLGLCYELAMGALTGWEKINRWTGDATRLLPEPVGIVHGTIHHRKEEHRIGHAWVMLGDGDVWEPITGLICDTVRFHDYARAEDVMLYDTVAARTTMLRNQHYGPWHDTDERGCPT